MQQTTESTSFENKNQLPNKLLNQPFTLWSSIKKRNKILIILLILIAGIFLFSRFNQKPTPLPQPIIKGELKHLQSFPPAGKSQVLFTKSAIQFKFDSNLNLNTAKVSIDPEIEIITELSPEDSKTLIVRPQQAWPVETSHTITIEKGLESRDGGRMLQENIIYNFEYEYLEDIMTY